MMLRLLRSSKTLAFALAFTLLFSQQAMAQGLGGGLFGSPLKRETGTSSTIAHSLRGSATFGTSLHVYGAKSSPTNYERAVISLDSTGKMTVGREYAGTGASNDIFINIPGTNGEFIIQQNGSSTWTFSSPGLGLGFTPISNRTAYLGKSSQQINYSYVSAYLGANIKTLTESAATDFLRVQIVNGEACSGHILYTVRASDATNTQAKTGRISFSAVASSTGVVTAAALVDGDTANPVSAGTLTNTMTQTTGANSLTFSANAASSLTQTTLDIKYLLQAPSTTNSCLPTAL